MKTTNPHPYRVLLADDQADIRDALRLLLKREGYVTQGLASPAEAPRAVESRPTCVAKSPAMARVLELIGQIGPSDANVLITGEHGTGKEVVARTLHALSARATKPMVTVNAGGLSEGVFESELFGHVKGAFTDARADRV